MMSLFKDHHKPIRDRIAREAEEAEARLAASQKRREEHKAYNDAAIAMITEGTRLYFAHRKTDWNYPHTGSLQVLLDVIRLEFYRYQKELGIGGQKEGSGMIPDDPGFGRLGRHAMSTEEHKAHCDYEEGKGPMPWFLMGDTDGPAKKP